MAAHSGVLAWETPRTEESWGHEESDTSPQLNQGRSLTCGRGGIFLCSGVSARGNQNPVRVTGVPTGGARFPDPPSPPALDAPTTRGQGLPSCWRRRG